jgi:hypothetical protein
MTLATGRRRGCDENLYTLALELAYDHADRSADSYHPVAPSRPDHPPCPTRPCPSTQGPAAWRASRPPSASLLVHPDRRPGTIPAKTNQPMTSGDRTHARLTCPPSDGPQLTWESTHFTPSDGPQLTWDSAHFCVRPTSSTDHSQYHLQRWRPQRVRPPYPSLHSSTTERNSSRSESYLSFVSLSCSAPNYIPDRFRVRNLQSVALIGSLASRIACFVPATTEISQRYLYFSVG